MKVILNINTEVTVTLTQAGADYYNENISKYLYRQSSKECYDKEAGVSYSFMLWELMHIFGEMLYMGNMKVPFVKNEIVIERAD